MFKGSCGRYVRLYLILIWNDILSLISLFILVSLNFNFDILIVLIIKKKYVKC